VTDGFVLDTNIVSELRKSRPNKGCFDWFGRQDIEKLYLTIITMAEIAQGIFMLEEDGREVLMEWYEQQLPRQFMGRILNLDESSVWEYGRIIAQSRQRGLNRPALDALIAAIAIANNCTIVTRNKRDFDGLGVKVVNPFT